MVPSPVPRARKSGLGARTARTRGAVLFVGLIILVIMTIVGISAMRGSALEERMAGNLKDKSDSLQAAEAAIQAALTAIEESPQALRRAPYGNRTPIADGCAVLDTDGAAACKMQGDIPDDWLAASGTPTSGALFKEYVKNSTGFGPENADQPRIQVQSRYTPTDINFEAGGEQRGIIYYTVSAVAAGPSGQSRTILQTTIPKVYAW